MDMFNTLVEAVVVSFLMGSVLGGVVVAHMLAKPQSEEEPKLQPAKIKIDRNDK